MSSERYAPEFKDEAVRQILTRRDVLRTGMVATLGATWFRSGRTDNLDYKPAVYGRPSPPQSAFGADSTAEEVTAGLELNGMTALLTGCNSGIGFETMRVLAKRGVHVIGAARTREKAEKACDGVDGRATPLVIELTEFDTIVAAAKTVKSMAAAIDMLILNAGVMGLPELQQVNGIERQFVINHLGHFLLVDQLKDLVTAAQQGRVIVVSSSAHVWAPEEGIQFDNLSGETEYDPFKAYGQSKLANGLFSRELARRFADTRATSNALHPGVIRTNLTRYLPGGDNEDATPSARMKSIPQGAATTCYVSAHPELQGVTGYYFADCNLALPNAHMQDDEMAKRLWAVSAELTASYRSMD